MIPSTRSVTRSKNLRQRLQTHRTSAIRTAAHAKRFVQTTLRIIRDDKRILYTASANGPSTTRRAPPARLLAQPTKQKAPAVLLTCNICQKKCKLGLMFHSRSPKYHITHYLLSTHRPYLFSYSVHC